MVLFSKRSITMNHLFKFALHATTFLFLLTPLMLHAQWSDPEDSTLIIRGGWLFDGVSDTRRKNSGIIIQNGEIAEVDADIQPQFSTNANVIDLQDSETILPGLIDLHAHYNLDLVAVGRVAKTFLLLRVFQQVVDRGVEV